MVVRPGRSRSARQHGLAVVSRKGESVERGGGAKAPIHWAHFLEGRKIIGYKIRIVRGRRLRRWRHHGLDLRALGEKPPELYGNVHAKGERESRPNDKAGDADQSSRSPRERRDGGNRPQWADVIRHVMRLGPLADV